MKIIALLALVGVASAGYVADPWLGARSTKRTSCRLGKFESLVNMSVKAVLSNIFCKFSTHTIFCVYNGMQYVQFESF
jgi:hypothetical protein